MCGSVEFGSQVKDAMSGVGWVGSFEVLAFGDAITDANALFILNE